MTFRMLTKLSEEEGERQVASQKYCMGPEAEDIMGTFTLTDAEKKSFDDVLKKFDEYFQPRKNILRLRKLFSKRTQATGETVEAFSRALHVMATDCEFGATKEERIRDQFIVGVASSDPSEKLELLHLTKSDVTLASVLDYARNYSDVRQERAEEAAVGAVGQRPLDPRGPTTGGRGRPTTAGNHPASECSFCLFEHERGSCPAYGKRFTLQQVWPSQPLRQGLHHPQLPVSEDRNSSPPEARGPGGG